MERIEQLKNEILKTDLYFSKCNILASNNKEVILKHFNKEEVILTESLKKQILNINYKSLCSIRLKDFVDIIKAYYKVGYESVTINSNNYDKISLSSEDYIKYSNTTIKVNSESNLKDFGIGKYDLQYLYLIIKDIKKSEINQINIFVTESDYPLLLDFGNYIYFLAPKVRNE